MARQKSEAVPPDTSDGDEISKLRQQTGAPSTILAEAPPLPLEFITLTSRPATQKSNFSYTVRSHAMQSYLQMRRSPNVENEGRSSQGWSKDECKSAGELSGKFKLASWSRKKPRKRSPGGELKGGKGHDESAHLHAPNFALMQYSFSVQNIEIDRSDAYATLPISMSPRTQSLLYHYNTGFTVNAFAINYDETWKPFSISDSALLHATLCLVAQHEDLMRGLEDSSENLYHKGQALKLINNRLLDDRLEVTDASISSVAILVILEAINGTFEAATAHQVGLMKMVSLRGGVSSLCHNPVLLRVISWSDIIYSTRWGTTLKFRTLHPSESSLISTFAQSLNLSPSHFFIYPDPELSNIIQTIQVISMAMDLPSLKVSERKILSEALYTAEHRLLLLEQVQSDSSFEDSTEMDTTSHAFIVTALLYLQIIIREVPALSRVHHRLVSKLEVFLEEHEMGWFDYSAPMGQDVLLWIMFVKAVAAPNSEFNEEMGLQFGSLTKEELRERLAGVAWRGKKCDPLLEIIWRGRGRQGAIYR